jgi:hypothetical protein
VFWLLLRHHQPVCLDYGELHRQRRPRRRAAGIMIEVTGVCRSPSGGRRGSEARSIAQGPPRDCQGDLPPDEDTRRIMQARGKLVLIESPLMHAA